MIRLFSLLFSLLVYCASRDPYKILGVPHNSDLSTIKKKYRSLSRELHPDLPTGDAEKFKEVVWAHDLLTDETARHDFDVHGITPEEKAAGGGKNRYRSAQGFDPFGGGIPQEFFSAFGGRQFFQFDQKPKQRPVSQTSQISELFNRSTVIENLPNSFNLVDDKLPQSITFVFFADSAATQSAAELFVNYASEHANMFTYRAIRCVTQNKFCNKALSYSNGESCVVVKHKQTIAFARLEKLSETVIKLIDDLPRLQNMGDLLPQLLASTKPIVLISRRATMEIEDSLELLINIQLLSKYIHFVDVSTAAEFGAFSRDMKGTAFLHVLVDPRDFSKGATLVLSKQLIQNAYSLLQSIYNKYNHYQDYYANSVELTSRMLSRGYCGKLDNTTCLIRIGEHYTLDGKLAREVMKGDSGRIRILHSDIPYLRKHFNANRGDHILIRGKRRKAIHVADSSRLADILSDSSAFLRNGVKFDHDEL